MSTTVSLPMPDREAWPSASPLTTYRWRPSGEAAMPVGPDSRGIVPTKSAGPKLDDSARARSNTATVLLCWRATKANLSSSDGTTWSAPFPPGALSDPAEAVLPDSRSPTRNTVIPLWPATSRCCRSCVNASPSESARGTVRRKDGTNEAVLTTTRGPPLCDTKPRWLAVTATSKGLVSTGTKPVRAFSGGASRAVFVVHAGGARTRAVSVARPSPPPPPPASANSRYATPAAARTTQTAMIPVRRRRERRGGTVGGPCGGALGGACGGPPGGRYSRSKPPTGSVVPALAGPTPWTRPVSVGGPPPGPAPARPAPAGAAPPGPAPAIPVPAKPASATPAAACPVPAVPLAAGWLCGWSPAEPAAAPAAAASSSGRTARVAPRPGTAVPGPVLPGPRAQARRSAAANSRQVPYRSSGVLASALFITPSTAAGRSGRVPVSGGGAVDS